MAPSTMFLAALFCLLSVAAAQEAPAVTYEQLKPTRRQWNITIATTKTADKTVFDPITDCNQTSLSAPCLQPVLTADNGDKVQFTYTLAGDQLKTADDLPAKGLVFQACYARPFVVDRPWRKPNAVVALDKSCPFVLKAVTEFNANKTYTITWPVPKNATKAAWYAAVYTTCQNGSATTFCGVDSTVNQTYFATTIINSTPVSMQIATAICAAIGPLFLATYFVKDHLARRSKA